MELSKVFVYFTSSNNNKTEKIMATQTELQDFAKNAKFKTSGSGSFTYFNINEFKQIRIWKKQFKNQFGNRVTLHSKDLDGITYKSCERNEVGLSLKDAKIIAAKFYFENI